MEIKTYDTILTEICDFFDTLISPATISRSNTNIVYLWLKACAKGWEVINNVCVTLNNKFNPSLCADEDLVSTGKIVGTKIRGGSVSGLRISVYNPSMLPVVLPAGTYVYQFDSDISFSFDNDSDLSISAESSAYFTALSNEVGAFRVTQQTGITVTADGVTIPPALIFSCTDNQPLLGHLPETVLEFRQRVNTDTGRQDIINELKEKLLALPYVYDCSLIFNQEESSTVVGEFTIPSYFLLIIISTAKYTNEIADIVAQSAIYPTVSVTGSHEVRHIDDVFANGYYSVWLNDFVKKDFEITLNAIIDSNYNTASTVKTKIESALMNTFNSNIYRASITAEDVFNEINKLDLTGVKVLGVSFESDGSELDYISFNKTELPNLTNVGGI